MVRMTALYRRPEDPEAFERAYFEEHLPLVRRVPGLERIEVARQRRTLMGQEGPYLVCDMYFPSMETFKQAMASAEGQAMARDAQRFSDIVTVILAEVVP